jgi:hypothetical protein
MKDNNITLKELEMVMKKNELILEELEEHLKFAQEYQYLYTDKERLELIINLQQKIKNIKNEK